MRWFLEHIQVVIAVAGIIAWWINQRRREKEGQSADYDGDGTPERNPGTEPYDDDQARRVREDIRRKIAERRGLATPPALAPEPPPVVPMPASREEAPPPVFQDPLQDMLKELQRRLAPVVEPATPPPEPEIDRAALERQREIEARYRELEARRARTLAQAEAIRIEQPSTAPTTSGAAWLVELRNAKNIRHAIIARELLGPPAGLR